MTQPASSSDAPHLCLHGKALRVHLPDGTHAEIGGFDRPWTSQGDPWSQPYSVSCWDEARLLTNGRTWAVRYSRCSDDPNSGVQEAVVLWYASVDARAWKYLATTMPPDMEQATEVDRLDPTHLRECD